MKNISRRVFIKGMAVAAVATAASTVLTGCKFPGVEEPVVEAPVDSKVMTFVDPENSKNTITLTFSDLVKGNPDYASTEEDQAVINVSYVNDFDADVSINPASVATDNTCYIVISTYQDGHTGMGAGVLQKSGFCSGSTTIDDGAKNAGKISLDLSDVKTSVTVKVVMKKTVGTDGATVDVDEKKITYTL